MKLTTGSDCPAAPGPIDRAALGNQHLSPGKTPVKAYLITTGSVFGLIAAMHLLKAIDEWPRLKTDPGYYLGMAALGVVAAALSAWAWRLLRLPVRS